MTKTTRFIFLALLFVTARGIVASDSININEEVIGYSKSVDTYLSILDRLAQEGFQADNAEKAILWLNSLCDANEAQKKADQLYIKATKDYEQQHPDIKTHLVDNYVQVHPEYAEVIKNITDLSTKDPASHFRPLWKELDRIERELSSDTKVEDALISCLQSEPDEIKEAFGHVNILDEKKLLEFTDLFNNEREKSSSYFQLMDQIQKEAININTVNELVKIITSLTDANEKKYQAFEIGPKINQFFSSNQPDLSNYPELLRSYIRYRRVDFKFSRLAKEYSLLDEKTERLGNQFSNNKNYLDAAIKMMERGRFYATKEPRFTQTSKSDFEILIEKLKMQEGDLLAQLALAVRYEKGDGVPKDTAKALLFLKDAAEKGLPEAQDELANSYFYGNIVPVNLSEAERLYRQAASSNKASAQVSLGCFLSKLDPQAAFDLFRKAAAQNDALGQFYLATAYLHGAGVGKNEQEAFNWFQKSALQKNPQAEEWLAYYYFEGKLVPKDSNRAASLFYDSAMAGLSYAQFYYATLLWRGDGVQENKAEAIKWFTSSANKGSALAEERLGNFNFYGVNMPINYQQAFFWNEKAAKHNIKEAQFLLGVAYNQGDGVVKSHDAALLWFQKAAERGDRRAEYNLAYYYLTGTGAASNIPEGLRLLQKSSDAGYSYAQFYLAQRVFNGQGFKKDEIETYDLCRKAAEQGLADAQLSLGQFLLLGNNCTRNDVEGIEWIRKAADQGLAEAEFRYGICCMSGIGLPHDPVEAVKWFRFGALQGNPSAQNALGYSYYSGNGISQNLGEAYKWYLIAEPQQASAYIKATIAANIRNILPKLTPAQIQEAKEAAAQFVPLKKSHSSEFYGSMGIS